MEFGQLLFVPMGYVIGCLQSAYIIGRLRGNIDIRQHGSGNAGMTNVIRVMGFRTGLAVLFTDVAKAVFAVILANFIFHGRLWGMVGIEYLPGLLAGLGVILGHNFPFYLGFKGGKGVASTLGVVIMFYWPILAIAAGVGLVVLAISRYMSLASLVAFAALFAATCVFFNQVEIIFVMGIICALPFYTHRANIVRLYRGNENRFGRGGKKT